MLSSLAKYLSKLVDLVVKWTLLYKHFYNSVVIVYSSVKFRKLAPFSIDWQE